MCRDSINKIPFKLPAESHDDRIIRELSYLNIKYQMITLINRKDRMTMSNSLEGRVPFADKRLVQYAFNLPKEMKLLHGREKGLLREAVRGLVSR
ncbi:MAG: asparagine synthase-related protein [Terrisporobacter sp.]